MPSSTLPNLTQAGRTPFPRPRRRGRYAAHPCSGPPAWCPPLARCRVSRVGGNSMDRACNTRMLTDPSLRAGRQAFAAIKNVTSDGGVGRCRRRGLGSWEPQNGANNVVRGVATVGTADDAIVEPQVLPERENDRLSPAPRRPSMKRNRGRRGTTLSVRQVCLWGLNNRSGGLPRVFVM